MTEKIIFYIDIDAFYASVEILDNPSLAGKPVIVGARPGTRGVVSACSYEARKFGIRSAMPISEAARKCPQAVFLPVRMKRYTEKSRSIMNMLKEYSPEFRQISIDEAVLDMTGTERLFGPAEAAARMLKESVRKREGLTLSVGIAPHAYLAKMASEAGKPDGLVEIKPGDEIAFLDRLELKDLWGVGKKTLARLEELNINSIARLRSFSRDILMSMMGNSAGEFLYKVVRGQNPETHQEQAKNSSLSQEITFERDRRDILGLKNVLLELAESVMSRLADDNFKGRIVFIKLRFYDFRTTTGRKTLMHWVGSTEELYRVGLELLKKKWDGRTPVRLIGIGVSGIVKEEFPEQLELFPDEDTKKSKMEQAVSGIRKKLKDVLITKASLLGSRNREKREEKRF